jgi:hypothetical protein
MATIEETYKARQSELGLDTIKLGAKFDNLPGGYYSGDQTPYSLGTGFSGKKDIDEEGLKKVEKLNASGNRYQVGTEIGAGSSFLNNGWNDKKKYSSSLPK